MLWGFTSEHNTALAAQAAMDSQKPFPQELSSGEVLRKV